MQNLKKKLPPLEPLVAFEAAARHLSFTLAAKELNLSQAAVSQQIRLLERALGVSLFNRSHRAVRLSGHGREYQHTVSAVLQQLATATSELTTPMVKPRLTVATDQSIASMWLIPRLPDFSRIRPNASLRLVSSDDEQVCLDDEVQIAIIHGNGSWSGFHCEQLFEEEVFPVCSPAYFESSKSASKPSVSAESLVDETLLELEDEHWNWMNWRNWLSHQQVHLPTQHRHLQMNSYPLLIDAAKNGQGIALGWRYLIDQDLQNGYLIRPTNLSVSTTFGYYLVWPEGQTLSEDAFTFREWVKGKLTQQRAVRPV